MKKKEKEKSSEKGDDEEDEDEDETFFNLPRASKSGTWIMEVYCCLLATSWNNMLGID
jgi:hypothetical protein